LVNFDLGLNLLNVIENLSLFDFLEIIFAIVEDLHLVFVIFLFLDPCCSGGIESDASSISRLMEIIRNRDLEYLLRFTLFLERTLWRQRSCSSFILLIMWVTLHLRLGDDPLALKWSNLPRI